MPLKWMIWGYPHFRKPSYRQILSKSWVNPILNSAIPHVPTEKKKKKTWTSAQNPTKVFEPPREQEGQEGLEGLGSSLCSRPVAWHKPGSVGRNGRLFVRTSEVYWEIPWKIIEHPRLKPNQRRCWDDFKVKTHGCLSSIRRESRFVQYDKHLPSDPSGK